MDEINAVGHRMVHGGEKFSESVRLTPEVLAAFTACNDLAPLHNPANLKGVNAISAILPDVPQIGVLIRLSTRPCRSMPIYMPCLMSFMKSMVYAVTVSTGHPIVMYHSASANSWV